MYISPVTEFFMNVVAGNSVKMLEPCEVKVSRTVLRRERGSNSSDLVDYDIHTNYYEDN